MGTVIKAGAASRLVRGFERLALKDHLVEARAEVLAARREAQSIVQRAEEEAARLIEESNRLGYEAGIATGHAKGLLDGREEATAAVRAQFQEDAEAITKQLESLVAAFESQKSVLEERAKKDLLGFAVSLAERIVKRTAVLDRDVATANLSQAIRQMSGWTDLRVRVHAMDLETMRQYASHLVSTLTGQHHIEVMADAEIGPGGCVVESATTTVDATLESQYRQAACLLLGDEVTDS